MRPPYSDCTGYHITYFDLDTQDYLNDSPTLIQNSKNIFDAAINGTSFSTSDFLDISHDTHNQTSQVLVEYMLQGLKAKGYNPVTVGDWGTRRKIGTGRIRRLHWASAMHQGSGIRGLEKE